VLFRSNLNDLISRPPPSSMYWHRLLVNCVLVCTHSTVSMPHQKCTVSSIKYVCTALLECPWCTYSVFHKLAQTAKDGQPDALYLIIKQSISIKYVRTTLFISPFKYVQCVLYAHSYQCPLPLICLISSIVCTCKITHSYWSAPYSIYTHPC